MLFSNPTSPDETGLAGFDRLPGRGGPDVADLEVENLPAALLAIGTQPRL